MISLSICDTSIYLQKDKVMFIFINVAGLDLYHPQVYYYIWMKFVCLMQSMHFGGFYMCHPQVDLDIRGSRSKISGNNLYHSQVDLHIGCKYTLFYMSMFYLQ